MVSRVGSGVGAVTLASRSCGVEMSLRIEHKVKRPSYDRPTDESTEDQPGSTTNHATISSPHAHPHSPPCSNTVQAKTWGGKNAKCHV